MAQEAKMISQADVVESLAAQGLVSVSEGAGQPQKNMELSKFADALGKAVPQQQDAEQVVMTGLYAQTSDGKMVELTKESVASVMAGLYEGYNIPINMQKFKSSYMFVDGADANDVRANAYIVNATNTPDGYDFGFIEVIWTQATGTIFQRFVSYDDSTKPVSYARSGNGTFWNTWQRIDNFGANTKEELASMVAEQMGVSGGKKYVLTSGQTIETDIPVKCLLISTNDSASVFIGVHAVLYDGAFKELLPNSSLSYGTENSEKVCVLVSNKKIIIKNNYPASQTITFFAISLPS